MQPRMLANLPLTTRTRCPACNTQVVLGRFARRNGSPALMVVASMLIQHCRNLYAAGPKRIALTQPSGRVSNSLSLGHIEGLLKAGHGHDEDLAVPHAASAGELCDPLDNLVNAGILNPGFDLHFR